MKVLVDRSLVPPMPDGGYRYADGRECKQAGQFGVYVPQTDSWIFAGDFTLLVELYRLHLIANRQAVEADLEGAVSEAICSKTPTRWKGCSEPPERGKVFVTWAGMKRWLRTMVEYARGGTLVEEETAIARAQTCLQCRYRVEASGCKGCGTNLAGYLTQLAINRTTPFDDQLNACGICGCALKALVHFPNDVLDKAAAGLEYPSDTRQNGEPPVPCWRRP